MQQVKNLCFDVGGMGIKVALFDKSTLVNEEYLEHQEFNKGTNTKLINIIKKIDDYIIKLGYFVNVGISFPGVVDTVAGKVLTKSFLQEIEEVFIYEYFKNNKLVNKIVIQNDAKSAAFGEFKNLNTNVESAFVVTVGSAVGGALILNKKIYNGKTGLAGEISKCYSNLQEESDKVAAHVASTMYLQRRFANLKHQGLEEVSGKIVMDSYLKNDLDAIQCVNDLINSLARLIFNIQVVIDVDLFLIGGGISANIVFIELLTQKIKYYFMEQGLTEYLPIISVCSLKNKAGCYGLMYKLMEDSND